MPEVTHLLYAALFEKPAGRWLARAGPDAAQSCDAAQSHGAAGGVRRLRHVSILQGTKAYGVHLHPIAVPARERWPRDPRENFYWLQEDYLRAGRRDGHRLHDLAPAGGFRRRHRRGDEHHADHRRVCRRLPRRRPAIQLSGWTALPARSGRCAPSGQSDRLGHRGRGGQNRTFNITNGDVFMWPNVWPAIADALGVEAGSTRAVPPWGFSARARWQSGNASRRGKYHLQGPSAARGHTRAVAPLCRLHLRHLGAFQHPPPALVSTVKLRQAGFGACIDTEDMFRDWFGVLQAQRILPEAN